MPASKRRPSLRRPNPPPRKGFRLKLPSRQRAGPGRGHIRSILVDSDQRGFRLRPSPIRVSGPPAEAASSGRPTNRFCPRPRVDLSNESGWPRPVPAVSVGAPPPRKGSRRRTHPRVPGPHRLRVFSVDDGPAGPQASLSFCSARDRKDLVRGPVSRSPAARLSPPAAAPALQHPCSCALIIYG